MKSWLIQSGIFSSENTDIEFKYINEFIMFKYMGCAEFEFGSLGYSLDRIKENLKNYSFFEIENIKDKKGYTMKVFCFKELFNEVKECVNYISKHKFGYKTYCDMFDYIYDTEFGHSNFWWDIQNDFMICFDNNHKNILNNFFFK